MCTLLTNYQWGMIWGYFNLFESNGSYVLGTWMHEHAWLSGRNRLQVLATTMKEIGTCNNMLVEHFRSRDIVGHWYPIVSIDFHEHIMTGMMVLRQGYALVFISSDARKPCQGMDYPRCECQWNLESVWLHRRGWPDYLRDCVAEKGRFGMDLFWSLAFPDGIRCILGVRHGTMSR